jgi:lysyl-tRNA synthetase class 2
MSAEESSFMPSASLATLRQRSLLLAKIRIFFEARQFIHVETPLISRDTVVDRYIEPVKVPRSNVVDGERSDDELFLQTSPEFAMKRLVVAGATAIYQICKAFRKGEAGRRHNPEFTMLEWYRVGDDLSAGMGLLADFAKAMFGVGQVDIVSYREAFVRYANVDPFAASIDQLRSTCHKARVDTSSFAGEEDRDSWLNLIMSEIVEPELGVAGPEIIFHFPASQAALAKVCADSRGADVAERFELYVNGVELANGYHELLDAAELERRNEKVNSQRVDDGSDQLPVGSRMLDAMRYGMPACSGVALGVDRLMMLLLEKDSISDVIAFPFDRA